MYVKNCHQYSNAATMHKKRVTSKLENATKLFGWFGFGSSLTISFSETNAISTFFGKLKTVFDFLRLLHKIYLIVTILIRPITYFSNKIFMFPSAEKTFTTAKSPIFIGLRHSTEPRLLVVALIVLVLDSLSLVLSDNRRMNISLLLLEETVFSGRFCETFLQ